MRVTAAKDGVQGRRRLRIFAAAVALVLLCAVCVGGVSGAEFTVSAESNLASIVNNANDGDVIVITEDYVISGQVVLSSNSAINITNAPGVDVTISGSADAGSLFEIGGGTLTVKGNDDGGSLTITTNLNGRAFYVDSGAALNIYDGVIVYRCGFGSANTVDNGGAVYVSNGGKFIMHGGLLLDNKGYKGGAVYVDSDGYFELKKGKGIITNNHALYRYGGGGVYAKNYDENNANVKWTGGDIKGNTASSKCDNNLNNIYPRVACPETDAPIRVGSGNTPNIDNCIECWSVKEAYEMMKSESIMTIFITRDFTQGYIETWDGDSYTTELDRVVIDSRITVNFRPYGDKNGDPLNLNIIDRMFEVSKRGSLVVGSLYYPSLIISGKNEVNTVDKGGFICINSATTASIINCEISDTKANKGGAIYLKSTSISLSDLSKITGCTAEDGGAVYVEGGTFYAWLSESIEGCTAKNGGAVYVEGGTFRFGDSSQSGSGLIKDCTAEIGGAVYFADGTFSMEDNAKITGCTAEIGGAVYFADGTFNVMKWATIDSSNDVYLSKDKVITAVSGYYGTIGKITLPEYIDDTRVVYIGGDNSGYPGQFLMNQEGMTNGFERVLEIGDGSSERYLVLVNTDFLIVIPSKLIVYEEEGNRGTMDIQASVLNIPKKSSVVITVDSKYDFNMVYFRKTTGVEDTTISLKYELRRGGFLILDGDEVTTFTMDKPNPHFLTAEVLDSPIYAGEYVDTLTFTIRYDSGNDN